MKSKTIRIAFLLLVLVNHSFSQYSFQRLIGGNRQERGQTLFQTRDGNYLFNGVTTSYGLGIADVLWVKSDVQGFLLWSKTYGTASYDNSEFAILAHDNSLLGAGRTEYPLNTNSDALLFKTDSAGTLLWAKTYGGGANDGIDYMVETSDNGFAMVGATQSIGAGLDDILLIKTDANGDTLFTRSYGTPLAEIGTSILQTPDSGFIISGKQVVIINGVSYGDGIILRTDAGGNLIWTKLYGDSLWEELQCVRLTLDGGIISCGTTITFGAGVYDFLCIKTDSGGDVQWAKTYGGPQSDAAYGLLINPDSTFTLSGYTNSMGYGHQMRTRNGSQYLSSGEQHGRFANPNVVMGDDSTNIILMKIDAAGDTIWTRTYGDGLMDEAYRNEKTADGGYLISGLTTDYAFSDSTQMLLVKTDSLGFTGCHEMTSHPITGNAAIVGRPVTFTVASGLSVNSIPFTETPVSPHDEDACLYTNVNIISNPDLLKIYPNPFSEKIIIHTNPENVVQTILITDLSGKALSFTKFNCDEMPTLISLDLSSLQGGMYFIKVTGKNNFLEIQRIIKI